MSHMSIIFIDRLAGQNQNDLGMGSNNNKGKAEKQRKLKFAGSRHYRWALRRQHTSPGWGGDMGHSNVCHAHANNQYISGLTWTWFGVRERSPEKEWRPARVMPVVKFKGQAHRCCAAAVAIAMTPAGEEGDIIIMMAVMIDVCKS